MPFEPERRQRGCRPHMCRDRRERSIGSPGAPSGMLNRLPVPKFHGAEAGRAARKQPPSVRLGHPAPTTAQEAEFERALREFADLAKRRQSTYRSISPVTPPSVPGFTPLPVLEFRHCLGIRKETTGGTERTEPFVRVCVTQPTVRGVQTIPPEALAKVRVFGNSGQSFPLELGVLGPSGVRL